MKYSKLYTHLHPGTQISIQALTEPPWVTQGLKVACNNIIILRLYVGVSFGQNLVVLSLYKRTCKTCNLAGLLDKKIT